MWEFLGNGGRVGFAFYNPTNWLEHETSKKAEIVRRYAFFNHPTAIPAGGESDSSGGAKMILPSVLLNFKNFFLFRNK